MEVTYTPHNIVQKINSNFEQSQLTHQPIDSSIKEIFLLIMSYLNQNEQKSFSIINKVINQNFFNFTPKDDLVHLFLTSINLKDPVTLKKYLGRNYKDKAHLNKALEIINRIYEIGVRPILDNKYGLAFPMNAEIIAYAMQHSAKEIILEIAGASGENGILLAFSDAKRVFVNDIQPLEMMTFRDLRANLPSDIKNKLEPIEGNCMDILKIKPKLAHKVGLVLCNNLLHLFSNEDQIKFFNQLKKILKPGGKAIIIVNSNFAFEYSELFKKHPESTCFSTVQCLVTDFEDSQMPCSRIHFEIAPTSENATSTDLTSFNRIILFERFSETNFKWKVNREQFQLLDPEMQVKINQAFQKNKSDIAAIKSGNVRVQTNIIRLYSTKNLCSLVKQNGFEVESAFVVSRSGHLVAENDFQNDGQQVGVIIKNSG